MSNSKDAVRKILDLVKADKRTSLTAPEGKLVCDAYGIPVPKEGVAKSAGDAARIASDMKTSTPKPAKISAVASERLGAASAACPTACLKLRILSSALNGKNSITSNARAAKATTMLRKAIPRCPNRQSRMDRTEVYSG